MTKEDLIQSSATVSVVTTDYVQYRLSSQVPMIAPKIIAKGPGYIEAELSKLTLEERSLYYDIHCVYCGGKLESQEEYDSHWCAARRMVKSYYKYNG